MVKRFVLHDEFSCNVFLITNELNEAILIDAGLASKRLLDELKNVNLKAILLTHGHFDHVQSLDRIKSIYPHVEVYCFEEDDFLSDIKKNCSFYTYNRISIKTMFKTFDNEIEIGGFKVKVYHTPGHTKGSVTYYFEKEKAIFFGDTIIEYSIGRTDLYSSSSSDMKRSLAYIKEIPFKDDDNCYFGHGESMNYLMLKTYNQYL